MAKWCGEDWVFAVDVALHPRYRRMKEDAVVALVENRAATPLDAG